MPLSEAEGISEPLTVGDANLLVRFLEKHSGVALQVVDITQELASGNPGDGCLSIGAQNTLQARFGVNKLAVVMHPKRFRLDEPSLRTYQRTIREEALAAARVEHEDTTGRGGVSYEGFGPEPDRGKSLKRLTDLLVRSFSPHTLAYVYDERALAFSCREQRTVDEYKRLAQDAGFATTDFKLGSREVPGISGPLVGDLLKKTLATAKEESKTDKLKTKDSHGEGPWVIVFDREDRKVIIGNKQFAQEHRARFLA